MGKLNKIKIHNHNNKDLAFLISNNVNIQSMISYDLKGSTQGRKTDDVKKQNGDILKDLNFIEDDVRVSISNTNKDQIFYKQLEIDTLWFAKHQIMDYSLLIGIADADNMN